VAGPGFDCSLAPPQAATAQAIAPAPSRRVPLDLKVIGGGNTRFVPRPVGVIGLICNELAPFSREAGAVPPGFRQQVPITNR
jgi:hypothetical protein